MFPLIPPSKPPVFRVVAKRTKRKFDHAGGYVDSLLHRDRMVQAGGDVEQPLRRNTMAGGYMDSPLQRDTMVQEGRDAEQPLRRDTMAGGDAEQPLRRNHKHNRAASEVGPVRPEKQVKRVVEAEIVNPLMLIDIRTDFDAWWEEFDRMYPSQTIEELDAEIEAKYPGWIKLTESWS